MGDVIIRPERPDDYAAVHEVHVSAFGRVNEAQLVEAIRRSPGFLPKLSLVAEHDGSVVGHILFSRITIEAKSGPVTALALAPMAVRPECQKMGVGSRLVEEGLDRCRRLGHRLVVVVGHPDFYPRFAFRPARARGLEAPFDVPGEAFLLWEAAPEDPQDIAGRVQYPPAFDDV